MKDGHIHTPYCPHGSNDSFEEYIERAIEVGLTEITFTEHLPLPDNFEDPSPKKDSAMSIKDINCYIKTVNKLKEKYKDKIKINLGVEVDYLEGYEKEIKEVLNTYGHEFDDAILSVHILNVGKQYYCMDFSKDEFKKISTLLGGVDNVYYKYYKTLKKAIDADLGQYKPKRIGHLNLVRKFNQIYPYDYKNNIVLEEVVKSIKEKGYEVDYNVSGARYEYCKEPYISGYLLKLIQKYDIPMVLGSDSHRAKDIGRYMVEA
ncbi:histidinol-phosphatase HisJ [Romboutsia maritimum]|uniref:Histidinol-phosphatase n=1 Tax=Romboutsia maritimum TaxID=2020948 RepID=A0A371IUL3_9FIRM|nr:histidinol-phosphatase HisJ [Romboutsia maritimum]RDY24159.1 histidinol-phosphatase HisJ [Romboutsia maritimum]